MSATAFFWRSAVFKEALLLVNTSTGHSPDASGRALSSGATHRYYARNAPVTTLCAADYTRNYARSFVEFVPVREKSSNWGQSLGFLFYKNIKKDKRTKTSNADCASLHTSVNRFPVNTPNRLDTLRSSLARRDGTEPAASVVPTEEVNRGEEHEPEEYDKRLRRRIQATGRRPSVLHRLQDPLTVHLYRVAASHSYRSSRDSVLVTGSTLVKELRKHFRCKRLLIGRRTPVSEVRADSAAVSVWPAFPPVNDVLSGQQSSHGRVETEIYRASDRVLKKLGGFHSYNDGIVAEMQLPPETKDFGDIKLMLCLGDPWLSQELDGRSKLVDFPKSTNYSKVSAVGMYGTLVRSAAALHWQGIWLLPKCPDIFSPLGTRASQGALFWMPYRRGCWEDLLQFAAERRLLLCVPHQSGMDAQSPDLVGKKAKGLCFVVDSEAQRAAQKMANVQRQSAVPCRRSSFSDGRRGNVLEERGSAGNLKTWESPAAGVAKGGRGLPDHFCPDRLLSVVPPSGLPAPGELLGSNWAGTSNNSTSSNNCPITSNLTERGPGSSCTRNIDRVSQEEMNCMHPLTLHTLLMYQLKRAQFPSTAASSYIFTVKKKQKGTAQ